MSRLNDYALLAPAGAVLLAIDNASAELDVDHCANLGEVECYHAGFDHARQVARQAAKDAARPTQPVGWVETLRRVMAHPDRVSLVELADAASQVRPIVELAIRASDGAIARYVVGYGEDGAAALDALMRLHTASGGAVRFLTTLHGRLADQVEELATDPSWVALAEEHPTDVRPLRDWLAELADEVAEALQAVRP